MNLTLIAGLLALALWLLFGFIVPVGSGWIHLLLGLAMTLFVRRVVTGPLAR